MAPKVAVVRCRSYDYGEIESSVAKTMSLVGGMGRFVKKGDRVLLKPNLLSASSPDKAITTHPSVVKAMVKQVQSAGATAIIADSPGGPFTKKSLEACYEKSGLKAVAEETGAVLNYKTDSIAVHYPDGRLVKRLDVMALLEEVDAVITLPKLKTHMLTQLTGATKILFGVVPGLTKPAYHLKFSEPDLFCDMLLDVLGYVKPSLSLMDGVIGIEGEGPGAHGTPKRAGVLVASEDSVALDVVAAAIIGMKPDEAIILRRAVDRGLTGGNLSEIYVVGEKVEDVGVKFRQPSGSRGIIGRFLMSKMLRSVMLNAMVPYPEANNSCVRCGICRQSCPAAAITITDKAHMALRKCIRCYCCHELCPHKAITLKTRMGWVRTLRKG